MSGKLGSECCGARPYFALGYVHGIRMAENSKYYGICGECKEHAEFNKQTEERKEHETNNQRNNIPRVLGRTSQQ